MHALNLMDSNLNVFTLHLAWTFKPVSPVVLRSNHSLCHSIFWYSTLSSISLHSLPYAVSTSNVGRKSVFLEVSDPRSLRTSRYLRWPTIYTRSFHVISSLLYNTFGSFFLDMKPVHVTELGHFLLLLGWDCGNTGFLLATWEESRHKLLKEWVIKQQIFGCSLSHGIFHNPWR